MSLDHSPVLFPPLEEEMRPIVKYLTGRVLNVGCGNRDITQFLLQSGAALVENCDIQTSIPGAFQCDIRDIPRPDAAYDSILCNAVLEHVPTVDEFMREMLRLLKTGGTLVMGVPFLQPYHACPTDFRRYTREGLRELAELHGFEVLEIRPMHSIAQVVTWIVWEFLEERRKRLTQKLLWLPLYLWNRLCQGPDFPPAENASAFHAILRKRRS